MINYKNAQDGFEPAPAPGGTPAPGLREGAGRGALPARPPARLRFAPGNGGNGARRPSPPSSLPGPR